MGGKGGEVGNPAPFVPSDGGVRRARPAGPRGRSLPGLSKLFLAPAGPGQRVQLTTDSGALWPGPARFTGERGSRDGRRATPRAAVS